MGYAAPSGAAFFIRAPMRRVISYIDGFNLYHAIDELRKPKLKWVDLWCLSESLLRGGERLVGVNYFSAFATWMPDRYARHRAYVRALRHRGVTPHMAKFKEKTQKCFGCGNTWISREEKETDVHIAVRLVSDGLNDLFDRAILITADSDLKPAVSTVRSERPKKEVFIAAPPGRYGYARDLNPHMAITAGRVAKCLLPKRLQDAKGKLVAERPAAYDP